MYEINFKMSNIPQIDIQKASEHSLHRDNIIADFPNFELINLNLKWIEIMQRIDNVNILLTELFQEFKLINTNLSNDVIHDAVIKTPLFYRQKFLTEQIFYWIRKTLDEIISIIFVLDFNAKNNQYPDKIEIESIGKLLNSKDFLADIKNKHIQSLQIINDISNTYKHSFMNSEIHTHVGTNDPLAFSYGFKHNNIKADIHFMQYRVDDIIIALNDLLLDFINRIKELCTP